MCKALDDWEKQNIQRGIQQGIQQGVQQGIQQGIQQGVQQGERTNAIQNARLLFKNGASLELVAASILVLSKEEVEEIYKEECKIL